MGICKLRHHSSRRKRLVEVGIVDVAVLDRDGTKVLGLDAAVPAAAITDVPIVSAALPSTVLQDKCFRKVPHRQCTPVVLITVRWRGMRS